MTKEKFKLINLATVKKVSSLFSWNYKTIFHWSWIEFEELKQYSFWEEVRNIDWLTSAKTWKTFIKRFQEERELEVLFLVDIWESMFFWSWDKIKMDIVFELFNILSFSSLKNNDKIWAIFFENEIKKEFQSKKWLSNLLNIGKYLVDIKQNEVLSWSNIDAILNKLYLKKKKNSLIFILTDYIWNLNKVHFKALSVKNDLVYINVFDEFEENLTLRWIFNFTWNANINLNDINKSKQYFESRKEIKAKFKHEVLNNSWDYMEISNRSNVYAVLYDFFKLRKI